MGSGDAVFELFLLLIGGPTLRRKWWVVGIIGLLWLVIGVLLLLDALFNEVRIPADYFAIPLLIMAAVSFGAGIMSRSRMHRTMRFIKGAVCVIIILLIIDAPWHSDIVIGFLVGTMLICDAIWRAGSAYVVRFPSWRGALALAGLEFLMGLWSFVPWPTHWRGEVGSDVAQLIIVAAVGVTAFALRVRRLPEGILLADILAQTRADRAGQTHPHVELPEQAAPQRFDETLIVHVWTPTGGLAPLAQGVQRYVVAQDATGAASTGHAALQLPPDLYISHYPAVEIERSPDQFARVLRATRENDVPGEFKPSYEKESAEWCPSTMQVRLTGINGAAVRRFWADYSTDATYNLTYRNCSSAVARALDAAIEGRFANDIRSPLFVIRLLSLPELWVAGLMRRRAAWMAWTPGMVLDYARAVSGILQMGGGRRSLRTLRGAARAQANAGHASENK